MWPWSRGAMEQIAVQLLMLSLEPLCGEEYIKELLKPLDQ